LASTLLQALLPHLPQQGIQEARVRQIVTEIIEARSPREVRVELPSGEKVDVGIVHQAFNRILQAVSANISGGILLVGGAGAGKTTTCHKVADALRLPFRTISVCKQTTLSHLVGFINVSGEYVSTPFREAYEKGGVFLLDEFDAGNENVVLALNSALANGLCEFPDKQIERHKDFRCLASANTYGTGATLQFVGRNKLDGATLDRFVVIEHDYDSKLEFALCGNDKWAERVLSIRKSIDKLGIRHIVSPRASINGAKLLAIGWKQAEVEQAARLAIQAEAKDESPEDLTKKIIAISGACDAVRNSREDIEKNEAMLKTKLEKFINLLEGSDEWKKKIQDLLDCLSAASRRLTKTRLISLRSARSL
jgi:MoxR-like ATPase